MDKTHGIKLFLGRPSGTRILSEWLLTSDDKNAFYKYKRKYPQKGHIIPSLGDRYEDEQVVIETDVLAKTIGIDLTGIPDAPDTHIDELIQGL